MNSHFIFLGSMTVTESAAHANCPNSTIRGDYAFTLQGQALSPDGTTSTGLINGVGVINFDGNGNLTQEDFVVTNGVEAPSGAASPRGFHIDESGTYTVNADCTGIADIVLAPGNQLPLALVISKSARTIHAVVSVAVVGGNPSLLQTRSDFERIDARE